MFSRSISTFSERLKKNDDNEVIMFFFLRRGFAMRVVACVLLLAYILQDASGQCGAGRFDVVTQGQVLLLRRSACAE